MLLFKWIFVSIISQGEIDCIEKPACNGDTVDMIGTAEYSGECPMYAYECLVLNVKSGICDFLDADFFSDVLETYTDSHVHDAKSLIFSQTH